MDWKWMWFVERGGEQLYLKLLCSTVLLAWSVLTTAGLIVGVYWLGKG